MWLLLAVLLLAVAGWAGRAAATPATHDLPVLTLNGTQPLDPVSLLPYIGVYRDDTQSWRLEDAIRHSASFRPEPSVISDGYVRGRDYWFRLRVRSIPPAAIVWWLRVERAYLDDVRIWQFTPAGQLQGEMRQAGDLVEHRGAQQAGVPTFELDLTAPGVHEVYLRVRTDSTAWIGLRLTSREQALRDAVRELLPAVLLFGASGTIFLLAAVAAVWLRERIYLVYGLFVLSNTLFWVCISGLAHLVLFRLDPPWADRLTASSLAVSAALGPWLYLHLLGLGDRARVLRSCLNVYVVLSIGIGGLTPWLGLNSQLTPWVLWTLTGFQLWLVADVLRHFRALGPTERAFGLAVILMSVLSGLNSALALGLIQPWAPLETAGPLAHVLNLALLVPYLLRQTLLARRAAEVAERRATTAELENRLKREDLEDKSNLVSVLAHEIRTPLAVIDAAMQSLVMLDDAVTPEREMRHRRIERALERLGNLMDMVVTRNRLDVSQWSQQLTSLNLLELTHGCIDELGDEAASCVDLQVQAALPSLQGDERMLSCALQNLLDNAFKYAPPRTKVQVRIEAAVGEAGRPGLRWSVRDQGPGIRPGDVDKVFQKYYRAGDSAEVPGLGLGLYLVRQIIERHGGRVWVDAVATGGGAHLVCWLPLAHPQTFKAEP